MFERNPVILLLAILSGTATAFGLYLKTGGPVDPAEPGFALALLFSAPGLLFAALVQVLNVKWLEASLLPRAVNTMKTVTSALFAVTFVLSVTFGLAFYGLVFQSFGDANRVTMDTARGAVQETVTAAAGTNKSIESALNQLATTLREERDEERKSGEGPRFRTLERALKQVEFAQETAQSVDTAELISLVEKAEDIAALRDIGRRATSTGAIEYQTIAKSLAVAENEVLSIKDNERQMHATMAATVETVRAALKTEVPPAAEVSDTFVSPVEWAFDIWGRLLTAPSTLDRDAYLAVVLAIVVDLFIAMLVVYEARRGSPMAKNVQVITAELSEAANRFEHVVRNVGLKDANEAIHRLEQNGNSMSFMGGHVVFSDAPMGQATFHNLMLALKAAGYAKELPFASLVARIWQRDWMTFDKDTRLKAFWIDRNRWEELQGFKLIALAAQSLDANMMLGDFIDWLTIEPRARERMGRNVDMMARTVARYFPESVGMRMSDMAPQIVDQLIADFQQDSGRALRASTRRTYISYFQTIIAAARGQGLLPEGKVVSVVNLKAA